MSFVGRLANYVLNEFLVNALANSKSFQRFAVRTDDAMRKGNEGSGNCCPGWTERGGDHCHQYGRSWYGY